MADKIEEVPAYTARITQEVLDKYGGQIRVWDAPMSAVDGAQVLDILTEPTELTVIAEQKGLYGDAQRAKVRYGQRQGWVLSHMLVKG